MRSGVNRNLAMTRADLVRGELGPARLSNVQDFTDCVGKKPCLVARARALGWSALVTVEVAEVLDEAIVSVALLSIDDDGKQLVMKEVQAPAASLREALKAGLPPVAQALDALLSPPPEPVVAAAPRAVEPVVEPVKRPDEVTPPEAPVVSAPGAPARSPVVRWVPAMVGVGLLAASGALLGVSGANYQKLQTWQPDTAGDPGQVRRQGETFMGLGIGLGVGGLAAVLTSVFWAAVAPADAPVQPTVAFRDGAGFLGVQGALR